MKKKYLTILIVWNDYNSIIDKTLFSFYHNYGVNFKTIVITPFSDKKLHINRNIKVFQRSYNGIINAFNIGINIIRKKYKKTTHIVYIDEHAEFSHNPFEELGHDLSDDVIYSCYHGDEIKYGKYAYLDTDNPFDYRRSTSFVNIDNNVENHLSHPFDNSFFVLPINKVMFLPTYLYNFLGINDASTFLMDKVEFLKKAYIHNPPYEIRMNPSDLYYYFRNKLILNKNLNKEDIIKYLKNEIDINLSYYRYNDVFAILHALNDYLKGEKYLSSLDLNYYHNFINTLNPLLLTDNELDTFFIWKEWEKTRETLSKDKVDTNIKEHGYQDENALEYAVIDLYNQVPYATYNVKKILNWDIEKSLGYVSRKNTKTVEICLEKEKELFEKFNSSSGFSLSITKQGNNKEFELFDEHKEDYENLLKAKQEVNEKHLNTKINDKQILFYVGTRLGFCCNPKYLLLELLNRKLDYKIIWAAHKLELCDEIRELGVEVISLHDHDLFIDSLYQSKIIIYNDSLPFDFTPKKEQTLINTWHGAVNYKRIGLNGEPFMSEYDKKSFMLANPVPTYFIAGTQTFLKDTAISFNYPEEIFLKTGLPRNDALINSKVNKEQTKAKLNIPLDKKICLYCPTFRKDNVASIHNLDFDALKVALHKRFGGEWEILYRGHVFTVNFWKNQNFIDVTNYPDQQDILLFTDVLISDYSSIMWDASLIDIPIFVYAPDYYNYLNNERGFTDSFKDIPYPISLNNEELTNNIINFKLDKYLKNIKKHHQEEGSFDHGDACKQIIDLIKSL